MKTKAMRPSMQRTPVGDVSNLVRVVFTHDDSVLRPGQVVTLAEFAESTAPRTGDFRVSAWREQNAPGAV